MKEQIITKLLCELDGLDIMSFKPFIRQQEFEQQFAEMVKKISQCIRKYREEYDSKMKSDAPDGFKTLMKVCEDDFVNKPNSLFSRYEISSEKKRELFNRLMLSRFRDWSFACEYGLYNFWSGSDWVMSFWEYLHDKEAKIFNFHENIGMNELFQRNLWGKYPIEKFYKEDNFSAYFFERIRKEYNDANGNFMRLVETVLKYLNMEIIKPLSKWILNIGSRSYTKDRLRLYNDFTLLTKGKTYKYINKNDCKEIKDVFVNMYFLSGNELLKVSVGSEKLLQRTVYLIPRDIQRADIFDGRIIELHMHKHFDPEIILFETEDAAYAFQHDISRQRSFRPQYTRRNQ